MADEEKKEEAATAGVRQDASTGEIVADKSAVTKPKNTMSVKVYAPFKVYYEGEAISLTAENETGPFDILPKHHNFLCMLVPCDLIINDGVDKKTVKISRALMHVKAEKVTVFVDV